MRRRLLILLNIIALFWALAVCANAALTRAEIKAQFERAAGFYDQKQFSKALEIYESLELAGVHDAVLLYNAGNACARLGDIGGAVLYYIRAERLAPRDRDIKENLNRLQPAVNQTNAFFLFKPLGWIKNSLSLDEWSLFVSILLFLSCLALGVRFLGRSARIIGAARSIFVLFAFLFILSGAFLSFKVYEEVIVKSAVAMKADTLARSGPGEQFEELYKLPAGTHVRVISAPQGGWVRIRLMDGRSAYLPLTEIRPVNIF